ncbi:cyclic nucleotide-binding domain-containing protein [Pedobacter hiemivivus]|uniref:Crp/Fnr family transcriptional regulator n=1 Tax=Pedobacter hiemivivus TaxID=2530454 RepID=A0A4R0NEG5_9SPHI|nr:Crp/Fnr family transcriptional regulator [Pedobacter hiemivivus]TCC98839.1 Crp/Fnr family transcriptional regulator [Pedobacter hiemivivus]
MANSKKKNRDPIPCIIHPMAYRRLFIYLNSILVMKDQNYFQSGLTRLLKGLYFKYGNAFYAENTDANVAAFVSRGLGFAHYMHPVRGKVVIDVFGPGEIALNPDSFFNGTPADTGLEFIKQTNILYVTAKDMEDLFEGFDEAKILTIKTLAAMFKHIRAKDELHRLLGKEKVKRFFDLYPMLLKPARQAPMQYKDIASYLNVDQYHFSTLMKELYPHLQSQD